MDVGAPSNFERLLELFDGDHAKMGSCVTGISISDRETVETISRIHADTGHFLDPHAAVGYLAAERFLAGRPDDIEVVTLATADPAKFTEIVEQATSATPPLPERLAAVLKLEKHSTVIESSLGALSEFLLRRFWQ
jgi:threonine synthase